MESSQLLQQFEQIEYKVDYLLEACKAFETENSNLREKVTQLEIELQKKNENEAGFNGVKSQIRSRLDALMTKLEDIQKPT
ncbi:MAG: cell division protein ZapB [Desulfobacterales bacterium]|nr:cell division protein ZapB [Desulfobacterales bacterium]MDD4073757.1 cell division protein ZapB [Desulfobacterales bacterium]MDD4393936.1 cell division protein ZapB [Desulfobacterales bacterium]